MKKKTILIICALLLCATLCACGESAGNIPLPTPTPAPTPSPEPVTVEPADLRPETVRVITREPTDLDPMTIAQEGKSCLMEIYEPLFTADERGGALTAVLADASRGENGISHEAGTGVYTIYLLPDLHDHAGNAVTAADAAFSLSRAAEAEAWTDFVSAEAAGESELTISFKKELTAPGALFGILSDRYIYSEKAYTDGEGLLSGACGTGPYFLESSVPGESMTLREWDGYRVPAGERTGRAATNVASILYLFEKSPADTVIALEKGDADAADSLPYADTEDFRGEGTYTDLFRVESGWDDTNYVLLANQHSYSLGKHESIRNGLFLSIDLDYLAGLYGEGGARACTAVCNPDLPDCLPVWGETETYQNKVLPTDDARAILRKVSYVNEPMQLLVVKDTPAEEIACAIQNMLIPRSITLYVIAQEEAEFYKTLEQKGLWDFAILGIPAKARAAELWKTLWTDTMEKNGTVRGFLRDTEFVTLLKAVSTEEGCSEENIAALMSYVFEHQTAMGLIQLAKPVVVPEWMSGATLTARGELLPGACEY